MRLLNLREGDNFHLRIRVQIPTAAPIQEAMTAIAMIEFLPKVAPPFVFFSSMVADDVADEDCVTVTLTLTVDVP